jgi:hypothetical protein
VVGLAGTCPYGIAACWGGANEALGSLEGVQSVDPIPDTDASTATVFLTDDRLPPLNHWHEQFRRIVNDSYMLRGAEVSLRGAAERHGGTLYLTGTGQRPPVQLAPLNPAAKVQWDRTARAPQPPTPDETAAYTTIATQAGSGATQPVTVTGPISQTISGYILQVRAVQP